MSNDQNGADAMASFAIGAWFQAYNKSAEMIGEQIRKAFIVITPALSVVTSGLLHIRAMDQLLTESGWLPHPAIPDHLFRQGLSAYEFTRALEDHIRANWVTIRAEIEARLHDLGINEESKTTFREGLNAYEAGLYRCVVRTLLPEIERCVRVDLNQGRLADPKDGAKPLKMAPMLKQIAGDRGLSETEPGGSFSYLLYRKLEEHLFDSIYVDEVKRQTMEADPVPNRNAALHGLVSYSTHQSALNAIFFVDYLLQIISITKEESP